MHKMSKILLAVLLFLVAIMFGYFTIAAFTANSNPTMAHVYTLVYILGIASAIFAISGIWLVVSSVKQPKNKVIASS